MADDSARIRGLIGLLHHVGTVADDALIFLESTPATQALLDDLAPKLAHLKLAAEAVVAELSRVVPPSV